MKKYFSLLPLLLFSLLVLVGCKKRSDKFLGPEYIEASENFAVENNNFEVWRKIKTTGIELLLVSGSHNFASNGQFYKAKFNERVSWTVTITGEGFNAQKVIKGVSDEIDVSNTYWDGGASNGLFFLQNDSITIDISFAGSSIVLSKKVRVSGTKNYNGLDAITGVKYTTIDDFEGGFAATTGFSDFFIDLQDVGGGNFGNRSFAGDRVQGKASYRMYGKDVNMNTYVGSCNTNAVNDFPFGTFTATNPDSLYVNLYIYGTGRQNSTISIIAFENDNDFPVGTYDATRFDRWINFVPVTWTGWQLVSIRYSSFRRPGSGSGRGNNQLTPTKLCGFAFGLDSYPDGGFEVEAFADMFVVTENGPFKQ